MLAPDPGAARGGLEAPGVGQRVAAALAGRRRTGRGPGRGRLRPGCALAARRLAGARARRARKRQSTTAQPRLAEVLEQPRGLTSGPKLTGKATPRRSLPLVRAMVLDAPGAPLRPADLPEPEPGPGQVAARGARPAASAAPTCTSSTASCPSRSCRSCPATRSSARVASGGERFAPGERVGVPWLGWTCGSAATAARAARTSATARASPATTSTAATPSWRSPTSASASPLPDGYPDLQAAPLLCAGLIGYRALRLAGDAERLGLYGFGAAAHIVCQVARHEGRRVFAFTRADDDGGAGLRARARRGVGRRRARPGARGARRRDHLRAGGRARAGGAAGGRQGRHGRLRAGST